MDLIKREDAIKIGLMLSKHKWKETYVRRVFEEIPSAEKRGEWIRKTKQCQGYLYACSECGQVMYSETDRDMKKFHAYCSRCGARMKGADDEID